ncbi:hypothetical protein ACFP1Z_10275 [Streptomyces gamaensis]|uniref:Uncharacterized protein n=1 Tax=Streptomyces gamaensis TaxID=1763542 RepID=A0ABW0YVD0_9ACTN
MTDGGGWLSALADDKEAVQLAVGAELLQHVNATLGVPKLSDGELRYLVARLYEALGDALRVAESRGKRRRAYPAVTA